MTRLRSLAVAGVLLWALSTLLWPRVTETFPTQLWLWPHLARVVAMAALFALSSFAIGLRLHAALLPGPRRDGHAALAFATGGFAFGLGLTLLGHLHLFGGATFWLYPLTLLTLGLEPLVEEAQRWWRRSSGLVSLEWWEWPLLLFGLGALALAVLPTFAPQNLNFDARWYHLGIAEKYVALGGIERSEEGLMMMTSPHLASLFDVWAMLWPGSTLLERTLLCAQTEVVALLGTLVALPPLVRALSDGTPRKVTSWAWLSLLLFPTLYVYDTGLMGGADHVAAWWVPTAALAWVQAMRRGDARSWALVATHVAAVALTKYTAAFFVAPFLVVVAGWFARQAVRTRSAGPLKAAAVAAGVGLLLTTPLWLRNLVWYHNPLYPFGSGLFPSTPWTEDSVAWAARFSADNGAVETADLGERLKGTLGSLWNYHLDLYTWETFTKRLPVFGSLFSLSVLVLPLVGATKRVWGLVLVVHGAIALWWNLSHQMRYLLVCVPVMAALAFVTFARAWRVGVAARLGVGAAVGVQLSLLAGVPFFTTHGMNGWSAPVVHALTTFGQGLTSTTPRARLEPFSDWEQVGRSLPAKARVLFHNRLTMTGLQRMHLTDENGVQYGLSWGRFASMAEAHARLKAMGVTHLAWLDEGGPPDSVAGELRFRAFASEWGVNHHLKGSWHYTELAEAPTRPERGEGVFFAGCGRSYGTGLYALRDLVVPVMSGSMRFSFPAPRVGGTAEELLPRAQYAVIETTCGNATPGAPWESLGTVEQQGARRAYFVRRDVVVPFNE